MFSTRNSILRKGETNDDINLPSSEEATEQEAQQEVEDQYEEEFEEDKDNKSEGRQSAQG